MKKILLILFLFSVCSFSQSKFALEIAGGIDFNGAEFDNGYSFSFSPVYHLDKIISVMANFAFHRAEGSLNRIIAMPDVVDYSIDDPQKPNTYVYDFSLGLRANFSQQKITPYFVMKTGFFFINNSQNYDYVNLMFYRPVWQPQQINEDLVYYLSPGLGIDFKLLENLSFLIEGRFNITTGTDYYFVPITTGIQYRL